MRSPYAASLALALVLSGCQAEIREGHFACVDGRCPAGWFCRPADDRCYRTPGSGDAGADGRPGRAALERCERDGDCASGRCYRGEGMAWAAGYCSQACSGMSSCPAIDEDALCGPSNTCLLSCTGDTCPRDFGCYVIDLMADRVIAQCWPPEATIAEGGATCTNDDDCGRGMRCVMGPEAGRICARRCGPGLGCAPRETCRPDGDGVDSCLPPI